jgi:hypothetical protein
MGPPAYVPPLKVHLAESEPANLVPMASTLPLDHQGRLDHHVGKVWGVEHNYPLSLLGHRRNLEQFSAVARIQEKTENCRLLLLGYWERPKLSSATNKILVRVENPKYLLLLLDLL